MAIFNTVYGGEPKWKPWANTLVYLPLNWDALDQSGNSRDGTLPSSSYYTWEYINWVDWQQCIKFKWASGDNSELSWTYADATIWSWDRTISFWGKFDVVWSSSVYMTHIWTQNWWTQWWWFGIYCKDWWNANQIWILRYYNDPYMTSFTYDTNRHHWVITYNNTNKAKMYVDGVQVVMTQNVSASFNTVWTNYFFGAYRGSDTSRRISFSNYIIENKERTADEITKYYNSTKANYS